MSDHSPFPAHGDEPYGDKVKNYVDAAEAFLQAELDAAGAPSGPAGGALAGTYPNPDLAPVITGQTFGDATHVSRITINDAGQTTGVEAVAIAFPATLAHTVSASGATQAIDLSVATIWDETLTANCTFTFTNPNTVGATWLNLILRQDGTGGRTVTWPGSVVWEAGSAPTLPTTASNVSILAFLTINAGTTWYGFAPASTSLALLKASNLSDLASVSTARTNLGLGTAALISSTAGGDLSGTLPSPTVAKINGVAVTGTPSSGQVPTATGSTAATWQTPSGIGALTSAHLFVGNGSNVATDTAVTGDVTITNAGVTAIGAVKVTNAMLAGSIDLTAKVTGALPLANGGTGQATAAAARASAGLNIDQLTTVPDTDKTIAATDRVVLWTSISAARVATLPAASAVNAGQRLFVGDLSGSVSTTNTITVTRAGSDTINGATTEVIKAAYGGRYLVSDGTSKWSFDGGIARKTDNLSVFAATTSAQLAGVLSDETGTGAAVFATSPALVTPTGIVKADVGLGNVDNTSNATERAATATLTNKRVTRRAPTVTQSATPTINTDNTDVAHITGLAQAITSMTTNLTGTPVEGDMLKIDFTDNGTARAITWGTSFEASTVALPTTTVISTRLDVVFAWNTVTSKWRCLGVA